MSTDPSTPSSTPPKQLVLPGQSGGSGSLVLPKHRQANEDNLGENAHRILVCFTCMTMEKMSPYVGRVGAGGQYLDPDPELEYLLRENHNPDHRGRIFRIAEESWNRLEARREISREMFKEQAEMVEFRDTLIEDAGKCHVAHNRPGRDGQLDCPDYRSRSKRLANPAAKLTDDPRLKKYLCDFCPYSMTVETHVRWRQGGYKK